MLVPTVMSRISSLKCPRQIAPSATGTAEFLTRRLQRTQTAPCEPGSKLVVLGMAIPPLIGNPYNGYINPYYWVDDHPLLYGNNGSLDPSTCQYPLWPLFPFLLHSYQQGQTARITTETHLCSFSTYLSCRLNWLHNTRSTLLWIYVIFHEALAFSGVHQRWLDQPLGPAEGIDETGDSMTVMRWGNCRWLSNGQDQNSLQS